MWGSKRGGRFAAEYYGCAGLSAGHSQQEVASAAAILKKRKPTRTSVEITNGKLLTYRQDGGRVLEHSVHHVVGISTVSRDKTMVAYITKSRTTLGTTECFQYVFALDSAEKVSELFNAVRDEKKTTTPLNNKNLQSAQRSASLCGDSPPNLSQFYEVLYLGKIKVSHKRAPPTFIDEAVKKIASKKKSDTTPPEQHLHKEEKENIVSEPAAHPLATPTVPERTMSMSDVVQSVTSKPVPTDDHQTTWNNKVMLMQIGRKDIRLISPDKKQVLVHKSFREISHCSCGQESKLNFGFICKEIAQSESSGGYVGYIFQCGTTSVVEDIMQGLKSAFHSAHETARKERAEQQCTNCPMVWFNSLCVELEGLPANKAQSTLLRKVEGLGEKESVGILAKMQGAETTDIDEQNQILMMLLRASCEVKQESHQHTGATIVHQAPQTPAPSQESVLTEAAKKAKRSLAESFNGIIRRKTSLVDTSELSQLPNINIERPTPVKMPHPLSVTNRERRLVQEGSSPELIPVRSPLQPLTPDKHVAFTCEISSPGNGPGGRQRARTVGSAGGETMKRELARKRLARLAAETRIEEEDIKISPQVSIFKKTGAKSPNCDVTTSRQHIYNKVTTPGKKKPSNVQENTPRNYRELWQTAIKQQILLNRMEKENQKMQADEELLAVRRMKLEYEDLVTIPTEVVQQWETILQQGVRCRRSEIRQHIGRGVCKWKRGEIWNLIVAQTGENTPPLPEEFVTKFSEWGKGYDDLKSQLTPHQHAILIDLGRTFPTHGYFSGALGPGQLGMFNLLKSYSILDPEVGYCQGLPFLVGVLMMHLEEEEESFNLLKFILFNLNLRSMFKPDMTGLQVAMYQLTRLLSETNPALYKLLDRLGVDPSLYATPWFLTLFAANFPLGFVARVVDLLILDGKAAIIKVGMCMLLQTANRLLECESLEEVMNIIKTELPSLPQQSLEDVIRQAASLNVSRQLKIYEVEYSVIQEEITLNESGKGESYSSLSQQNQNLKNENAKLCERISYLEQDLEREREALHGVQIELREEKNKVEDLVKLNQKAESEREQRDLMEAMNLKMLEFIKSKAEQSTEFRDFYESLRGEEINGNLVT